MRIYFIHSFLFYQVSIYFNLIVHRGPSTDFVLVESAIFIYNDLPVLWFGCTGLGVLGSFLLLLWYFVVVAFNVLRTSIIIISRRYMNLYPAPVRFCSSNLNNFN